MKYRLIIEIRNSKECYLIEEKLKFLGIKFWKVVTVGHDYEKVKDLYESKYEPLNNK